MRDAAEFCNPGVVGKFQALCKGDFKNITDDKDVREYGYPYPDGEGGTLFGRMFVPKEYFSGKHPVLLIFPGPYGDGGGKYEREVARKYARKGFAVFVVDYFPTTNSEDDQGQVMAAIGGYQPFLQNTTKAQRIARLGYDAALKALKDYSGYIDTDNVVAIGFCFGGSM